MAAGIESIVHRTSKFVAKHLHWLATSYRYLDRHLSVHNSTIAVGTNYAATWVAIGFIALAASIAIPKTASSFDRATSVIMHGTSLDQLRTIVTFRRRVNRTLWWTYGRAARFLGISYEGTRYEIDLSGPANLRTRVCAGLSATIVSLFGAPRLAMSIVVAVLAPKPVNVLVWTLVLTLTLPIERIDSAATTVTHFIARRFSHLTPSTVVAILTLVLAALAIWVVRDLRGRAEYQKQVSVRNRTALSSLMPMARELAEAVQTYCDESVRFFTALVLTDFVEVLTAGRVFYTRGEFTAHHIASMPRRTSARSRSTHFDWTQQDPLSNHHLRVWKFGTVDLDASCASARQKMQSVISAVDETGTRSQFLDVAPRASRSFLYDLARSTSLYGVAGLSPAAMSRIVHKHIRAGKDLTGKFAAVATNDAVPDPLVRLAQRRSEQLTNDFRSNVADALVYELQLNEFVAHVRREQRWRIAHRIISTFALR